MTPGPAPTAPETVAGEAPLALVMGGGGARAAYQAGFLRGIAQRFPELETPILVGVSAGAINAVHLAAHPGTFAESVEDLVRLWQSLTMEQVFRVDARSLAVNAFRWGLQLASGGHLGNPRIRALVDTEPLRRFLIRNLGGATGPIGGIEEKLEAGRLRAVAISTSSYSTGGSVTWIEGRGVANWARPRREARPTRLTVDHVMASAALPLFFPAVRIGREWYGDGGIRLAAPLSPAVHLGAGRILAVSTRFDPTRREAAMPMTRGYPPPAQVIGSLLNAVFLDHLDQDAWRVERINDLLSRIPEEDRGELRIIRILTARPSLDLGRLSNEFEVRMPGPFRFLIRGLGTRETESPDLLSFLLFDPAYLAHLVEIGERDALARIGELESVLVEEPERDPIPGVYAEEEEGAQRRGPGPPAASGPD